MKQSKSVYRGFAAAVVLSLTFFTTGAFAQDPTSSEVIYQDWTALGEAPQHIDFSSKVVGCNGVNQVLLNVFNENPSVQTIDFTITVKNEDGNEITKQINLTIGIGGMNIARCGDSTFDNLKINLPANYNASNVKVSIAF